MRRYLLNALIALDQLGNALLAGNNPDETISSAVGRKAAAGGMTVMPTSPSIPDAEARHG